MNIREIELVCEKRFCSGLIVLIAVYIGYKVALKCIGV